MTDPTPIDQALVQQVRGRREALKATQQQLADAMRGLGFDWKRETVTEFERGGRRLTIAEWLGLARVFKVPALDLLWNGAAVAITKKWTATLADLLGILERGTSQPSTDVAEMSAKREDYARRLTSLESGIVLYAKERRTAVRAIDDLNDRIKTALSKEMPEEEEAER